MFKHPLLYVWIVLISAFVGVGLLRPADNMQGVGQANAQAQHTQAESTGTSPAQPAGVEQKPAGAKPYAPDCKKPENHEDADFCQQVRMADAAETQNRINSFGLGALILTLVATGIAAYAAVRTVYVMKNTGERQLRAYVTIVGGHIRPHIVNGQQGLEIFIQFKNSGQTPGYGFSTWRDKRIDVAGARPFTDPPAIGQRGATSIIGPGATADLTTYIAPVNNAAGNPLLTGASRVFIWGQIDYRDIYGEPRHFKFKCWNSENFANNIWGLSPHPEGYEAN